MPAILLFTVPLLLAVPVWAGTPEDFRKPFYAEALAGLRQLSTTREHAAFVLKHKVDLVIAAPEDGLQEGQLGLYDGDKNVMLISADMLSRGADELRLRGVAEAEFPRVLAWKFLPTLAHEIRHAMMSERLRRRFGIQWHYPTLEDEMVSFVDTVRVLQEVIDRRPEHWTEGMLLSVDETNGELLKEWRRDPAALKELVEPHYPNAPSLFSSSRQEILALFRRRETKWADLLKRAEGLRASIAALKDPAEREEARRKLEEEGIEADARAKLRKVRRDMAWISEKGNFERLRDAYRAELKTLVRRTR